MPLLRNAKVREANHFPGRDPERAGLGVVGTHGVRLALVDHVDAAVDLDEDDFDQFGEDGVELREQWDEEEEVSEHGNEEG
jgi:hypothetical protein